MNIVLFSAWSVKLLNQLAKIAESRKSDLFQKYNRFTEHLTLVRLNRLRCNYYY